MQLTLHMFLIVCPLVFLGGFVDSIAGGGGLITLPAYLLTGLPAHNAIATNKLSSALGTLVACIRFLKNKTVILQLIFPTVVSALIGSAIGARLILMVSDQYIQYILLIVLPIVAYFVVFRKNTMQVTEQSPISKKKQYIIAIIASFIIGTYDGFYGPGTGTFLVLALTGLAKINIREATGNTKIINLASNIAALVTFLINGKTLILLGLAASIFSMAGSYIGSGMVLKNGDKIVRPIIIVVLILLLLKILL
ncbi:sulfite exporter TauE/SafE family protein [Anaerosporobacter sp.]